MEHIGKYRIIRQIGKGATAVVYLCDDPGRELPVAVKMVDFTQSNAAVSRRLRKIFRTEGTVALRLDHPNIVRVYDAAVEEKYAFIAMEYINGISLEEYCRIDHLLPFPRVISIIFKCCLALDYAFHQGVIHRDIKPANILLTEDDDPKIADFGLALNIDKNRNQDSTFIMGMGSPAYMSPEQVKAYPLNQKTDLYSLGIVLFQMLTGRLPFRAKTQATLIYKILNMDVPRVSQMNPNVPEELDDVIRKALEKDTYSRYKNGAEFAKDLSNARFRLISGNEPNEQLDDPHFEMLRKFDLLGEFENVEIWELLRSSVWRHLEPNTLLFKEGDTEHFFCLLVSGRIQLSIQGKAIYELAPGEIVGELGYLRAGPRTATAVTLEHCQILEINGSALALASEELQEHIQKMLVTRVVQRLHVANKLIAQKGVEAVQGVRRPKPAATAPKELALLP